MPSKPLFSIRDYWSDGCCHYLIVVNEARALLLTLQACKTLIANSRLNVHTDNKALMKSWLKQSYNSQTSAKHFWSATPPFHFNLSLVAGFPSRTLSDKDCMLSKSAC